MTLMSIASRIHQKGETHILGVGLDDRKGHDRITPS